MIELHYSILSLCQIMSFLDNFVSFLSYNVYELFGSYKDKKKVSHKYYFRPIRIFCNIFNIV